MGAEKQNNELGGLAPFSSVKNRQIKIGICFALALLVWGVFGQTLRHDFINYDDNEYVYENSHISQGLSVDGAAKAFTQSLVANWHPLTSFSLMLDCQLYGLNPRGHHFTNVLLHMATAILLFGVLHSMTGSLWRSAFAAALFAIHPLRVESVAWISERKDVLSGLFFMLTLGAYVRYARGSGARGQESGIKFPVSGAYGFTVLFFTLGLMSKPMLVTLPFVLLLLDGWPLGRFSRESPRRLILEKIPFFALTAVFCVITVVAQEEAFSKDGLSILWRMGNAIVSTVTYVRQMIVPAGLTPFYPHPGTGLSVWKIGLSLMALVGISWVVLAGWKKRPYLLVGWLWYLGMLVPVLGVMQVGRQAHADRYTYLPQIGLCLLVVWAVSDACTFLRRRQMILSVAALLVLAALMLSAHQQTTHWRDSISIWTHTLKHTEDNDIAHLSLGEAFFKTGNFGEAVQHFEEALQIQPNYAKAHSNMGGIFTLQGDFNKAIEHLEKALQLKPDSAEAKNNWAWILATCPDAALRDGKRAIELAEDVDRLSGGKNPSFLDTLAAAYAEAGNFTEAVAVAQRALELAAYQTNTAMADNLRARLLLYQKNLPYHEKERANQNAER